MNTQIEEAIKVFKNGGIVIFPTDTAIGIGCRIDDEKAIERLLKIRKRSESKPMLALVDSVEMAQDYLLPIPEKVRDKLIKPYWPGKLTIVLKCNIAKIPFPVRDLRGTLGVRFPDNSTLLKIIKEVGFPIVAPSANFSGNKTPFRFEELNPKLVELADYVLKEELSLGENVSTIIDCSIEPWKVIRKGSVKIN